MVLLDIKLYYNDKIFDAHTHIIGEELIGLFVKAAEKFNITRTLAIIHDHSDLIYAKQHYPNRFVFAKYFSGAMVLTANPDDVVREVNILREQGYSAAKTHFAPFWIHRISEVPDEHQIDCTRFDYFFNAVGDIDVPIIIHVSDPDTYYATRYTDKCLYGTKEQHIQQFSRRLERNPDLRVQAAHFAAQPEIHRLDNLAKMLKQHKNLYIDTSSARWMARELGKDSKKAREFFIKFEDRILFATDCVTRTSEVNYYEGRYFTLRTLLETDIENYPLPFEDQDTAAIGGTFINGLNLPESVLEKIYWNNGAKLYQLE